MNSKRSKRVAWLAHETGGGPSIDARLKHFLSSDMCGILFRCCTDPDKWKAKYDELKPVIKRRGPDASSEYVATHGEYTMHFFSTVLSLRSPFTTQPIVRGNHVLQYNGELYNDNFAENDTRHFYDSIQASGVVETLEAMRGEYAFVYYDSRCIWFARDCIGRRSLLYNIDENGDLFIASASFGDTSLREVPGKVVFRFDLDNKQLQQLNYGQDIQLPYPKLSRAVSGECMTSEFESVLLKAVEDRLVTIPEDENQVAILFSGGLDCTLIASMVDQILPKEKRVDLLNVAFENKRTGGGFNTPDRKLGLRSWHELNSKRFRFVELNIPFDETLEHRARVQGLMYPKESVMDLSIALAFYFASRGGSGSAHELDGSVYNYTSRCKVLLSGLGADELFGGYSRHARQHANGYDLLADELQMDFDRLHERNLGRDDRVCAIWGKEVRYPFLDERVVSMALGQVPLDQKVPNDTETKYLLRQIALERGLTQVAAEKKRAIQFGAKSAKMEVGEGRIKGHEKLASVNNL